MYSFKLYANINKKFRSIATTEPNVFNKYYV